MLNAIGDALDEFLSRKNVQKSEQNRKKYKKPKQSRNKPNFFPILHKFQSNNGEKREKSNSAKIWALLLFSSLFSRLLFSRFLFEFKNSMILKNSNDFCHSYAGFILAAPRGMLLRHQNAIFEKKIQIKA